MPLKTAAGLFLHIPISFRDKLIEMKTTSTPFTATAAAHPNIAFIKYWGNRDQSLRLPASGSLSMNLDGLFTRTTVTFSPDRLEDTFLLNGKPQSGPALERVSAHLEILRSLAGKHWFAYVESENNFPTGAGIASSASAFAALTLASACALELDLSEMDLSRLARRGSGSASRSIPGGFVEWFAGVDDASSYAVSIAPAGHWDLVDCIAIVKPGHKPVGSSEGHRLAGTSPLQQARILTAAQRLDLCRDAILHKDIEALAIISELDCHLMHEVMMTSSPSLVYWQPESVMIMQAVVGWRLAGVPVFYTLDAGPNVHVLCPSEYSHRIAANLRELPGVLQVLSAHPGRPAQLVGASRSERL